MAAAVAVAVVVAKRGLRGGGGRSWRRLTTHVNCVPRALSMGVDGLWSPLAVPPKSSALVASSGTSWNSTIDSHPACVVVHDTQTDEATGAPNVSLVCSGSHDAMVCSGANCPWFMQIQKQIQTN